MKKYFFAICFVLYFCLPAYGKCNLEEKMFQLPDSKDGNLVFQKLYSCDGVNWFKEPPAQEEKVVQPTSSYYRTRYGKSYGGYGPPPPFYNHGYQGDSWLVHKGPSFTNGGRGRSRGWQHYGVEVRYYAPNTRGEWRSFENSVLRKH